MSVNITVNGKFSKQRRKHLFLDDPQVLKQEEQERRKQRLLQVREQSKQLAKKIRDEVNEEKKRELQKLQAIKEKELECWRQHAMQRNVKDFPSAIFQIGTTHKASQTAPKASQKDNQQQAEKQKSQGTYKSFKKQMAARKAKQGKVQFSGKTICTCQQINTSPQTKFKCACTQTENYDKYNEESPKRKRNYSFSSSESECEDEGYKEQTLPQSSLSSTTSSCDSSVSFANNRATQTSMFVPLTTTKKSLHKTPAVFLDVEVGTDDSISITAPVEIKDKYAENNRQFSSIIRVSPSKGNKKKDKQSSSSTTTTTISSTTQSCDTENVQTETSNQNSIENTAQLSAKEKRFTIIADLVKKQQDLPKTTDTNALPTSTSKSIPTIPPISRATSETVTPQLSPRKQTYPVTSRPSLNRPISFSPRKASASSKSSKAITEKSQPTLIANTRVPSGSSSSGRVQFYDYRSKFSKECDQIKTTAKVQRQHDVSIPTAMEQAALENQRERERQQELQQKCQKVEERGLKALEREQVRRDCNELTEKLEALTREYPQQSATIQTQPHLFADKQLRKEGKMNAVVEELLNRPNIITCSELNQDNRKDIGKTKTVENLGTKINEINVGASAKNILPADDVSSDSCCSILLGYVDDQSRLVRQDLQQYPDGGESNQKQKQKRLQNLLQRLDKLRNSLIQELKTESLNKQELGEQVGKSKTSSNEKNLRQVIDSISELRKEREQILINDIAKESKPLRAREKELQAKEAILEEKVREFYELQKQKNKIGKTAEGKDIRKDKIVTPESSESSTEKDVKSSKETKNKENIICTTKEDPLEIIITVRGESKSIKIPQNPKRKQSLKKSPSKLATLIRSPQRKISVKKRQTPKKKLVPTKTSQEQGVLKRQNSYDSNSTSYMSLPAELPNKINDLAQRLANDEKHHHTHKSGESDRYSKNQTQHRQISSTAGMQESESSLEPFEETSIPPARINPLIAQYVQRLLGMSRNSVQKLGVSSSDIETPGSTIINTSGNVNNSETMISDERLLNIHSFVEENRSFIKDLEQSIKTQNNESLENSLRIFDEIWRQRLKTQKPEKSKTKHKTNVETKKLQDKATAWIKEKQIDERKEQQIESSKKQQLPQKKTSLDQEKEARTKELIDIISSTSKKSSKEDRLPHKSLIDKENTKDNTQTKTRKPNKDSEKSISSQYSTDSKESLKITKTQTRPKTKVDKAIETRLSQDSNKIESDTQIARYAKLTENCTHRIAELTELITRVREEKQKLLEVTLSSVSDTGRQSTEYLELPDAKSSTRNDQEDLTRISSSSEETTQNKQSQSSNTLHDMPKLSTADKNKQITASRDSGIAESRPITAQENRIDLEPISQTSSENTLQQPLRKMKPPPTIKRFSPQLPDDELVHELSTILEVDTPATSRINTAVGQSTDERINVTDIQPQQPVRFPTFEEYVQQLDLDITLLDSEQSIKLHQEFCNYLEHLQQQTPTTNPPQYTEFPSVNAYIKNLIEGEDSAATLEESLALLHIRGINPNKFPAVREYIKRNASKSSPDDQQLLDTESLENITEERNNRNSENDSDSIDIEKELKERNIMKNSFRYVQTKQQHIFSSTAKRDAAFYQEMIATESGIDKLSTSDNTIGIMESDLKRMVQQCGAKRKPQKKPHILSSTTTSADTSALANSALKAIATDDSSKEQEGRPLNLRDFLTRELLKHANISSSTTNSSSDESLRSHFLHSIIGSLTPRTTGAASKSGAKTSTPVPMPSTQTHSTTSNSSSSQLFSGESRLSSVYYNDRSIRFFTSDAANNADQSSE